jgi:DNA-binding Xre family transcriptional regulator
MTAREGRGELMQWNLRLRAAERGIWKSAQMRRMLADAGLEISAGKMSSWWAGTPPTMRLEELDVLCAVLECTPNDLMTPEPAKVAARRPRGSDAANGDGHANDNGGNGGDAPVVPPRFGMPRSTPPL